MDRWTLLAPIRRVRGVAGRTRHRAGTLPTAPGESFPFRGYADYAIGEEFARGLTELLELAAARPTAAMCSEALWWRCHRRWVADRLVAAGDSVLHISSGGRASAHELTPFTTVQPDGQITYLAAAQVAARS